MSEATEQLLAYKDAEIEALRKALTTLQQKHNKALELLEELQVALQDEPCVSEELVDDAYLGSITKKLQDSLINQG